MRKIFYFILMAIMLFSCFNSVNATYTGETPYTFGEYTVTPFLSSGTFTVPNGVEKVSVLVVAGGGSGGSSGGVGGGGGAGGVRYLANHSVTSLEEISITVGAGGLSNGSANPGNNGANSVFDGESATGGGQGGHGVGVNPSTGGSGGAGGGYYNDTGAAGTSGQGYAGGNGTNNPNYGAGAGGGCGGVGGNGSGANGGNGGAGCNYSTYFGTTYGESGWVASGGAGGGTGTMGTTSNGGGSAVEEDAQANTGGGGGTAGGGGGDGGSGVVLIRYLTADIEEYEKPEFTSPENASTIDDTLEVTLEWDYDANYSYNVQVSKSDTFAVLEFNESSIDDGNVTTDELDNEDTYYARIRGFHIGDSKYSNFSRTINFTLEYVAVGCRIEPIPWHSSAHGERLYFTVDADYFVNSTVYDFPIPLKIANLPNYWDLKGNDDENDLKIYGHDNSNGQYSSNFVELYYQVIDYNATAETLNVWVNAPILLAYDGYDPQNKAYFIIYTDYNSTGTFEDTLGYTWYQASDTERDIQALAIYNFEDYYIPPDKTQKDAVDSSVHTGRATCFQDGYTPEYFIGTDHLIGQRATTFANGNNNQGSSHFWIPSLSFDGGSYTILTWSASNQDYDDYTKQTVIAKYDSEDLNVFEISLYDGYWHGNFYDDEDNLVTLRSTTVNTEEMRNQWKNIVVKADTENNIAKFFFNGVIQDTDVLLGNTRVNAYTATLGVSYRNNPSNTDVKFYDEFNWTMDEIWIYDSALPDEWIQLANYAQTGFWGNPPGYANFVSPTSSDDPAAKPVEIPSFTNPNNNETYRGLSLTISWEDLEYDEYQLVMANNSDFDGNVTNTYTTNYTVLYPDNNTTYYLDIRSLISEGVYSCWFTDYRSMYFTYSDQPLISNPAYDNNLTTVTNEFMWSSLEGATSYDIEIYTNAGMTELYYSTTALSNSKEISIEDDDTYYLRIRGKDNFTNGTWSETLMFRVAIVDTPFTWETSVTNVYAQEHILQYYFTELTPYEAYVFNINRLNTDGTFHSLIATQTVTGDAAGEGDFGYNFTSTANYPFEVEYADTGTTLKKHYVMPKPTTFHDGDNICSNRINFDNSWIVAVSVGDVTYNPPYSASNCILHDPTDIHQSLYTQDEYIIMHYQIPPPEDLNTSITIKHVNTNQKFLIDGKDLFAYNGGSGYGEYNFIIIPLDGEVPDIVDSTYYETITFEGEDWLDEVFGKGVYYYYIDMEDDLGVTAYGESIFLVGDSTTTEWTFAISKETINSGAKQTYTSTFNTEEIWDVYKNIMIQDYSSGQVMVGEWLNATTIETEVYPTTYLATSSQNFITSTIYSTSGSISQRMYTEECTSSALLEYGYILTDTYTIGSDDLDLSVDSFLEDFGLDGSMTKLVIAMFILIAFMIGMAVLGMSNIVIIFASFALFIVLLTIGLIPLWTIIIIGGLIFIKLYGAVMGGGGDE